MKGFNSPKYDLKGIKGKVCTMTKGLIPTFGTTVVKDIMDIMTHAKCLNGVVEPVTGYSDHIVMARFYGY